MINCEVLLIMLDVIGAIVGYIKGTLTNLGLKSAMAVPLLLIAPMGLEIYAFLLLITIDTITGTIYAVKNQNYSSRRMRDTVFKVFAYMIVIITSRALECTFQSIWETNVVTIFLIIIISITEFSSIMENLIGLGVPLPKAEILAMIVRNVRYKNIGNLVKFNERRTRVEKEVESLLGKYINLIHDEELRELTKIRIKLSIQNVIEEILNKSNFVNPSAELLKINMNLRGVKKNANDIWRRNLDNVSKVKRLNQIFEVRRKSLIHTLKWIILDKKILPGQKKYDVIDAITKELYNVINDVMIDEDSK